MSKSALLGMVEDSRRKIIYHEEDGKKFIEQRQDVEHIVEAAKVLSNEPPGKDFRRVALIPESELNRAFLEGWFHDAEAWKRWANDPGNRAYRTWEGRL